MNKEESCYCRDITTNDVNVSGVINCQCQELSVRVGGNFLSLQLSSVI